jgi:hypothetical protein
LALRFLAAGARAPAAFCWKERTVKRHWHVYLEQVGCLQSEENYRTDTLASARRIARDEVAYLREAGYRAVGIGDGTGYMLRAPGAREYRYSLTIERCVDGGCAETDGEFYA